MIVMEPDNTLASAYAKGSEEAFRALVSRHVDLVFGTAIRQVGDRGVAEEITQNVFIALAKKAPSLTGHATLAGWLHRTTILESKTRIRAELRRREREEEGAKIALTEAEGEAATAALIPLLDEGLMTLRDTDRVALLLRFFEDRSLREVGEKLGVDEDAARKRVSRAIEKLTAFFHERGITAPSGAAAVLLAAGQPAPGALAATAAQGALAATATHSFLGSLAVQFMAITKTQTVVGCVLLAAAPLAWNWRAAAAVEEQTAQLQEEFRASAVGLETLAKELERLEMEAESLRRRGAVAEQRLAAVREAANQPAPKQYAWDDNSPLMRVPKAILQGMPIAAFYPGLSQITPNMKLALQMTDAESGAVESSAQRMLMEYHGLQMQRMQSVEPTSEELKGGAREDVRVFEIPELHKEVGEIREAFLAEIESTLGEERSKVFRQALDDWMPMDDKPSGLNTGLAVISTAHRMAFYKPEPGAKQLPRRTSTEMGMMNFWVDAERVPAPFAPYLQDWIQLALTPQLP